MLHSVQPVFTGNFKQLHTRTAYLPPLVSKPPRHTLYLWYATVKTLQNSRQATAPPFFYKFFMSHECCSCVVEFCLPPNNISWDFVFQTLTSYMVMFTLQFALKKNAPHCKQHGALISYSAASCYIVALPRKLLYQQALHRTQSAFPYRPPFSAQASYHGIQDHEFCAASGWQQRRPDVLSILQQ